MKNYDSNICSGSLFINENRIIADLLLKSLTDEEWQKKIFADNILQKKSPVTARKQARLIRGRLQLVNPDLREIIATGDFLTSTQGILVSAVKESRLLGDFIRNVVRRKWETHTSELNRRDWEDFLKTAQQISPNVADWGDATKNKAGEVVFRILAEAKMIESTRKKKILSFSLMTEVKNYLFENNEKYVLECLDWI